MRRLLFPHSRSLLSSIVMVIVAIRALAGDVNYDFRNTSAVDAAYEQILQLRIGDARSSIDALSKDDQGNLFVPLLANYCDLIELFLSEDETLYDKRKSSRSERIELVRNGPESSPWYRHALAELYMQWGTARLKYGDYLSAAADVNRAFRLLKKNTEEFPDFGPSYKNLALVKMVVGTIPDKYVWAVKLFSSLDGDVKEGFADLERCRTLCKKEGLWLTAEVDLLYAEALIYFKNDIEGAWSYLEKLDLHPETNDLHAFVLANTALKRGRTDDAIAILSAHKRPPGVFPIYYLDMMHGKAVLYQGGRGADKYLKRFLSQFNGVNYIKEAYQKLAWDALLKDDSQGYADYMDSCRVYGDDNVGEDKNALKEARLNEPPQTELLRVRLAFDGAYYDKAGKLLDNIDREDLSDFYKLEYDYRKGRLLHETGRLSEALEQYAFIIRTGSDDPRYFACNSAYQSGLIYESLGRENAAANYFETCLNIHPDDYQNSLHQKAKAGLNRLRSLED